MVRGLSPRWKWQVRLYYGPDAQAPKVPGELALETVHVDDFSKDMEVDVALRRRDIGTVEVIGLDSWRGSWRHGGCRYFIYDESQEFADAAH